MAKQTQNVWISAAVISGAALLLLALSSIGSWSNSAPAAAPAPPLPGAQVPAAPAAPAIPALPAAPGQEVSSPTGLKFIDRVAGTGAQPSPNSTVVVHYDGFLDDGTKFDSSRDRGQPAEFPLNQVVPGFSEGIVSMKVGGQRTLIIPAELGYGAQGRPPVIPPNARLRFEVELIGIK
jgi:peptidylprolyl isomerase